VSQDDRHHRIAILRSDEVVYLNREASNRARTPCCPHLDVFHNDGHLTGGGTWRACIVSGCNCMKETPSLLSTEEIEKRDRADRRVESWGMFLAGCAFGFVAAIVAVLL
jgi:hypothetical protein